MSLHVRVHVFTCYQQTLHLLQPHAQVMFYGQTAATAAAAFVGGPASSLCSLLASLSDSSAHDDKAATDDSHRQLLRAWAAEGCELHGEAAQQLPAGDSRGPEVTAVRVDGLTEGTGCRAADPQAASSASNGRVGADCDTPTHSQRVQQQLQLLVPHSGPKHEDALVPLEQYMLPSAVPQQLPVTLPYASYRLVTSRGVPVERPDKHPFCLSRVHYGGSSSPKSEIWYEHSDRSIRWRQSVSKVEIICLRVPQGLAATRLDVSIQPYDLRVRDAATGEVFLEGQLERGVVPGSSTWTYEGGEGGEGCVLMLTKMNLELFER